jgi:hypothetical protein
MANCSGLAGPLPAYGACLSIDRLLAAIRMHCMQIVKHLFFCLPDISIYCCRYDLATTAALPGAGASALPGTPTRPEPPPLPPPPGLPLSRSFRLARSCLQNASSERPDCRWSVATACIAKISEVRRDLLTRRISRMTSRRREYHCTSDRRPARHRLPHWVSNAEIAGWPGRPAVYSCQRASTVLTARLMVC